MSMSLFWSRLDSFLTKVEKGPEKDMDLRRGVVSLGISYGGWRSSDLLKLLDSLELGVKMGRDLQDIVAGKLNGQAAGRQCKNLLRT